MVLLYLCQLYVFAARFIWFLYVRRQHLNWECRAPRRLQITSQSFSILIGWMLSCSSCGNRHRICFAGLPPTTAKRKAGRQIFGWSPCWQRVPGPRLLCFSSRFTCRHGKSAVWHMTAANGAVRWYRAQATFSHSRLPAKRPIDFYHLRSCGRL